MHLWKYRSSYWSDLIEKEIGNLDAGEERALLTVYCAFAVGDQELMRRAGRSIRRFLEGWSLGKMLKLYERFRSFTSLEWSIDWAKVPLEPVLCALSGEEQKFVLILGTFHPNGYFRGRCMEKLAKFDGALPYLMLRANDWAGPVRQKAFSLLESYMDRCSMEEILSAMPVLEKLERSGRRPEEQFLKLKARFSASVEEALKRGDWRDVWPEDFAARRYLYRMTMESGLLTMEQMDFWLRREKEACGMVMLIRGILRHPDCTLERAAEYLSFPNARIRKCALEYRYEHVKESWPELPRMLLDSGRSVREYAAYILERHTDLDIREFYLEHLKDERPEYAILGLSECSKRGNVAALLPGLSNPRGRVQRYTILALGQQEDFEDEELLWKYLLDERPDIAKAAWISMKKRDFYPGAEKIYHAYLGTDRVHNRRYLLRLLLRENSWSRLPWLIRIYNEDLPEQEKWMIQGGMACRFMYTKVPEARKQEIRRALEEKQGVIPERIASGILYDMKFV